MPPAAVYIGGCSDTPTSTSESNRNLVKTKIAFLALICAVATSSAWSHDYHPVTYAPGADDANDSSGDSATEATADTLLNQVRSPADAFRAFSDTVNVRTDSRYLLIESNGLPSHPMMVGIRSWQQQVPLPQPFTGSNAWKVPLHPKLASRPLSAKTNLFRGAIAIAVNGVPIFNALNNRGEDAFLAGELDNWGGHCGRGDDYHYHVAPVHLEDTAGKGNPIAYALDGFPIYGITEADGSPVGKLDQFNGQFDTDGNYHYHATETYPYINGGMRGEVTVSQGQIDPQPRDSPARPPGQPLRGATITGFNRTDNRFRIDYNVSGRTAAITYVVQNNGELDFTYEEPSGNTRTESYRRRGGQTYLPLSGESSSQQTSGKTKPDVSQQNSDTDHPATTVNANRLTNDRKSSGMQRLNVKSSGMTADGQLSIEFTGDGSGESPPINWTSGPPGTQSYAVTLWHTPPSGGTKSYWLIYDIPPDVTSLPRNVSGIGTPGNNDKGQTEYDPMRSRGPGAKTYHITVYALSEKPALPSPAVTRDELLPAIANITLASGTLTFQYTRSGVSTWQIVTGAFLAVGVALTFTLRRRSRNRARVST